MAFNCFSTCLADFLDFQMLSLGSHLISLEFLFDFLRFQSTSLSFNLLVDHNEGSGKTLLMLLTLRNFYSDSRPKVIIFPRTLCAITFIARVLNGHHDGRTTLLQGCIPYIFFCFQKVVFGLRLISLGFQSVDNSRVSSRFLFANSLVSSRFLFANFKGLPNILETLSNIWFSLLLSYENHLKS